VLHELLTARHQEIVSRAREKTAARSIQRRTGRELDQGVSLLLDQIGNVLRVPAFGTTSMKERAGKQGRDLLRMGFSVSYVVHSYGDVCQAVTDLALELDTPVATNDFRVFNRCLDEAMASALAEYERQRDAEISRDRAELLHMLVRELSSPLSTALSASRDLRCGAVQASTSLLLDRSLLSLQNLIDRAGAEVAQENGKLLPVWPRTPDPMPPEPIKVSTR
jgi:hypothetical protein